MALNALIKIAKADGECLKPAFKNWIEIQGWDWEVEADTTWTKGGGAAVGKPNPGKFNFEHYWDKSSAVILGYICTGSAFETIQLQMFKQTGSGTTGGSKFFDAVMSDAFITKVSQNATDEGNLIQKVELVFKKIEINYSMQNSVGVLVPSSHFEWDIPAGRASPGQ